MVNYEFGTSSQATQYETVVKEICSVFERENMSIHQAYRVLEMVTDIIKCTKVQVPEERIRKRFKRP